VDSLHDFKSFDRLFSNSYKFTSNSNRFTLNYRIQNPKYNINIGSGLQFLDFNSHNTTKDITVQHNYINFTPTVNFQYSFSRTQRLRFFLFGKNRNALRITVATAHHHIRLDQLHRWQPGFEAAVHTQYPHAVFII